MSNAFAICSRRVVTPDGERPASIVIHEGRIDALLPYESPPDGLTMIDAQDACVLPGLVDTHVHVNEPGRTTWEGFETATRAAAAGGVTTLVDMPLNSIPATTTAAALRTKRAAARGKCAVDVGFWGGVVPGNLGELAPLAIAGVLGFKCFLAPSGVDEFGHVGEPYLAEAMAEIARIGLPLLVHAELPRPIDEATERAKGRNPRRYDTWLASRPPAAECEAIRMMIRLCRDTGCRVHIVHLSAAEALGDLREARRVGLPITVETCPHYLALEADQILEGETLAKCAPPIRDRVNRDLLWEALAAGDIDLVVSDHSPSPPSMKRIDAGDFMSAWGGIASLEVGLAAVWTEARVRKLGPEHLARWMSERPAVLAGLSRRKGSIAANKDADLVVWDADAEWVVEPERLHQRHKLTPYAGRRLRGRVLKTFVRGELAYDAGTGPRSQGGVVLQP